jgi:hypothetical protein
MKASYFHSLRRPLARCAIAGLIQLLFLTQIWPAEAKGFMQWECGGSVGGPVTAIHLIHLPGGAGNKRLTLRFLPSDQNSHPVPAEAFRCLGKAPCERAIKAEIEFQYISDKKAAGTYHLEFSDGRNEEGTFAVRAHQKFHGVCI